MRARASSSLNMERGGWTSSTSTTTINRLSCTLTGGGFEENCIPEKKHEET